MSQLMCVWDTWNLCPKEYQRNMIMYALNGSDYKLYKYTQAQQKQRAQNRKGKTG